MLYRLWDNESRRRWRTRRVSVEGDIEGVDSGFSTRNWARMGSCYRVKSSSLAHGRGGDEC